MPHRVLLDTDIGDDIDDAWALATCIRHPDIELVGVTTVHRDTELRAAEARYLLEVGGVEGVEVVAGSRDTLDRIMELPRNNQADVLSPQDEARLRPGRTDAVPFLAEKAQEVADLVLLPIGPMTNIGRFVTELPDDFARVGRLVIMGGHVMPDRPEPEYNAGCDPRATRAVFASGKPITTIGLDVTLRCQMQPEDLEAIRAKDTSLSRAIMRMTELWQAAGRRPGDTSPPRMPVVHDPLAALVVAEPELVKLEPMRVEIDQRGNCLRTDGEPNVQVAVDVDPEAVRRRLVELIG